MVRRIGFQWLFFWVSTWFSDIKTLQKHSITLLISIYELKHVKTHFNTSHIHQFSSNSSSTHLTQFQEKFTTKYNHTPFNLAQPIHSSKPITLEVICYLPQQHLTISTQSKTYFKLKLLKFLIKIMRTCLKNLLKELGNTLCSNWKITWNHT